MNHQTIEHIAAGQFKAGKAQDIVYQAYLGTCLGVALYDQSAQTGGMIHILLPEPTGIASAAFPEKYASTGVIMLIKELIELGAAPENLKASIAGGALVGPVSQQDINLDIGGRSAEIVRSLLEKAGIKTIKSETGGFFTCTLELDMATGKTFIRPAQEYDGQLKPHFNAPSLDNILNTIDQLKPIPQTALKLLRMFQSNRSHLAEITQELSRDQVLAGQTLKLCNSALFTGMMQIDTIKDAVLLLGEDLLIKSVITAAVNAYYNQAGTSGYSLCRGGLFFNAVGVACAAEKIAERSGRVSSKAAYTAGLLHDIGKVVLDQYVAESSPLFFRELSRDNKSFMAIEKKILGITHGETGALLAKRWNFSQSLSEVIRLHHTPELAKNTRDLATVVYLATLIMEKFNSGFNLEKIQTQNFEAALDHLGFTATDLPELIDAIPINAFGNDDLLKSQR